MSFRFQSKVLTDDDKAIIEAVVSDKERSLKHRIVFVRDTAPRRSFISLLSPPDKGLPCVQALIRRNMRSVSLGGYAPTWASLSAAGEDGWYGNKGWLALENYMDWISLPGYSPDGQTAAIYISALVHDQTPSGRWHLSGTTQILRFKKAGNKWQIDGTIGRVMKM